MLYLKIENEGVAPIEGFVLFGATSKRNNENPLIIGTFGSGSKMAVGTLLRADINPQVFCGLTKMEFLTKPVKMKATSGYSVDHKQVHVQFTGQIDGKQVNRQEALSFVLDYGTHDWTDVGLALREFVSNALDGQIDATGDFTGVKIDIVEQAQVRAKDGFTRVFIPVTPDVQSFYNNLGKWFLHFSDADAVRKGVKVLEKKDRNRTEKKRAVIYRKGVLVREFLGSDLDSLFDYNLDLDLNEARTFNDWEAKVSISKAIRDAGRAVLARIFKAFSKGEKAWELTIDNEYGLVTGGWEDTDVLKAHRAEEWAAAAQMVLGDEGVFCTNLPIVSEMMDKKGFMPVKVESQAWLKALQANGVRTDDTILDKDDKVGRQFHPTTAAVDQALEIVWDGMESLGMVGGKSKPKTGTFSEPIVGEGCAMGLYRPEKKTVYVNTDFADNLTEALVYIMAEETIHHLSGATDFSRDFQTMQTQIIGRLFYNAFKAKQGS